jgi:hypothetical protein
MKNGFLARAVVGLTAVAALPGAALAQAWVPGSEIVGQPVQAVTEGVTNTIYFDTATTNRIVTPGNNAVGGNWGAANQQICMTVVGIQECWPYTAPFQAGVPVTMTSLTSSKVGTWTALSVNGAPPPPPPTERGERGR